MRARNIKPGFFKNDQLAECSPLARILFAGLWCFSDREGRFEWRPKKIKAEILPYDDCIMDDLLQELKLKVLITQYGDDGEYGNIPNFIKHQNPHVREAASVIPSPEEYQVKPDKTWPEHSQGSAKVMPEHSQGSAKVMSEHSQDRLIPDSLIPDSLIPDSLIPEVDTPNEVLPSGSDLGTCPQQKIVELYHQLLPELPKVISWTEPFQKMLRARWREDPDHQFLAWWEKFFKYVSSSPFLMGKVKGNGWQAYLGWMIKPVNFTNIINGAYHRGKNHDTVGEKTARSIENLKAWMNKENERQESVC